MKTLATILALAAFTLVSGCVVHHHGHGGAHGGKHHCPPGQAKKGNC